MMLRICFLSMALIGGTAEAADTIRPVMSWDDYYQALIERGQSGAQARADIAESLESLRDMDREAGADRVGVAAPPFKFDAWINSAPLTLEDLRGKVVLVRWWTDTCPFCAGGVGGHASRPSSAAPARARIGLAKRSIAPAAASDLDSQCGSPDSF